MSIIQSSFVLAACAVSFCAEARAADPPSAEIMQKIRGLYQDARSHSMKQDYAKANDALAQILQILPRPTEGPLDSNHAQIHYEIAGNHSLLGKKKEALQSLGRAIDSGYWNHAYLSRDPNFKDLKAEKEFQGLVEKSRRGLGEIAFGLKDLAGKEISKKDYEGKAIIIDVWGTWCPPCRAEIPHFVKLQEKYRDRGLRIIGLTHEKTPPGEATKKNVEEFATRMKINYPLTLINDAIRSAIPNFQGYPTTIFVGRDGLVADQIVGLHEYGDLEARALRLLEAKETKKAD